MDIQLIRKQFPALQKYPTHIFFDNAATTQKPQVVLEAMQEYYLSYCANVGRGTYSFATKATSAVAKAREHVAHFIHATPPEIVFTSGATASLNTICYSWGLYNLQDGDEILFNLSDHQSAILPLLQLKELLAREGKKITLIPFSSHSSGDYSLEDIKAKVSEKTALFVGTHVHSVYGLSLGIEKIKEILPSHTVISVDASQSIGHMEVDVEKMGIDFLSFSGHKMFAATGIGVLYVTQKRHSEMNLFLLGGSTDVYLDTHSLALTKGNFPEYLQAGTPPIAEIISLGEAVKFVTSIGVSQIESYLMDLTQYLLSQLRDIKHIQFLPGPAFCRCAEGVGILSFQIEGMRSSDVGFILNEQDIFVRTGNHCITDIPQEDSIRVSFHVYNTVEEIDRFVAAIREIVNSL